MSGWTIGFLVSAIVVLAVVALLLLMITWARKVAATAEAILAALHDARDNTKALWKLPQTNDAADRIRRAATAARQRLEGTAS